MSMKPMPTDHANKSAAGPTVQCGTVLAAGEDEVEVSVEKVSACDQCRAKLLCASMRGSLQTITARHRAPVRTGDRVRLELSPRSGLLAVGLAFVLPLIILIAVFWGAQQFGALELTAGLAALGSLPVYYLALYTQRRRLAARMRVDAYPVPQVNPPISASEDKPSPSGSLEDVADTEEELHGEYANYVEYYRHLSGRR